MFVACAYPIISNYVDARTPASFKSRQFATADEASKASTAYDMLGLSQLPTNNTGEGVAWFVEVVDGSEGLEDPVSRSVDGRATQLTS
jgi:hypothetical protein